MKNFYTEKLVEIWQKSVHLYESGHKNSKSFPIDEDLPFLEELGMNKMDIFDFAEDWLCEGEPDLPTFLLIHEQRRDYFWEVQKKVASTERLIQVPFHPKILISMESGGSLELFRRQKQNFGGNYLLKPCFVAEETAIFPSK